MAQIVRIEQRKRGIFGTIVWWLFLAFNAFMAAWMYFAISSVAEVASQTSDAAQQAGAAIGGTIASGMILWLWLLGAVILGLIVALSRGKKVTIEKVIEG